MTWLLRYRVQYYVRNSIWLLPAGGMAAGMLIVWPLHWLESKMGWVATVSPEGARAVLGTMASSMFTLVVFVSSALLVVLQLASTQLSPRIIGVVFRNQVTKLSITAFVFTFTVTLATLARIDITVPLLTTDLATYCCIGSLVLFLYMIDHLGKALRPSGVLRSIAQLGKETIEAVYPRRHDDLPSQSVRQKPKLSLVGVSTTLVVSPRDGVLLAFDFDGLASLSRAADCTLELLPQVGDFVAKGSPLFRVSSGGNSIASQALCQSVFLGQERTLEHDPTFAFRILVDIAAKALSPAINDPTTAVLAIDQIQHLLQKVGSRYLNEGQVDGHGERPRIVYRTPDWEDFVRLAVTEIRLFGGDSIQVARRLRAMLQNLIQTLPERRSSVLHQELKLLNKMADRSFGEPEDRALAEVSDVQGVGGSIGQWDGGLE